MACILFPIESMLLKENVQNIFFFYLGRSRDSRIHHHEEKLVKKSIQQNISIQQRPFAVSALRHTSKGDPTEKKKQATLISLFFLFQGKLSLLKWTLTTTSISLQLTLTWVFMFIFWIREKTTSLLSLLSPLFCIHKRFHREKYTYIVSCGKWIEGISK